MTKHAPLSAHISQITGGGSDGWDLFRRARAMKVAGAPIIELTIGEHDIRTASPILREMHAAAEAGHTGYSEIAGTSALREVIAARIQAQSGVPTTPDNIIVTPGGQFALFAAHQAACDPGDAALFIDPYYATYPGTIRAIGAKPVPIAARAENGFQPQAADIAAQAGGARSLMINSPNNPTGVIYSRKTLEDIAQVCHDHDLWLISDEVYDTQIWSGTHISPRSLPDMAQRTFQVGSLSKSHAMTGSRVGWVCGPEDAVAQIENLTTHTTYGLPGYIQDAAHYALSLGADFETEIAAPFKRRRAIVMDLLAGQNVVKSAPCDGAMYAFLDIRATGLSGEDFANQLLDTAQIAVMPGESFGQAADGHVRVAMTVDDPMFETAIQKLLAFAAKQAD